MIGSILISLLPLEEITLPGLGGEALHGLFYSVLKTKSPDLAARLHDRKDEVPFSVSPFLGGSRVEQGHCIVAPDRKAIFRLAFLEEEVLLTSVSAFFGASAQGRTLELLGRPVRISEVSVQQGRLVSFTSFSKILSEASSRELITLEFFTPTCFKAQKMQLLFPEPRLVFSSLLKKWNTFSTTKLPAGLIEGFGSVKVAGYDLHTSLVHFSKYKIIGAVGRVSYQVPRDSTALKSLNALADFAFYCGTGAKTTMGMGQTRRLK